MNSPPNYQFEKLFRLHPRTGYIFRTKALTISTLTLPEQSERSFGIVNSSSLAWIKVGQPPTRRDAGSFAGGLLVTPSLNSSSVLPHPALQ